MPNRIRVCLFATEASYSLSLTVLLSGQKKEELVRRRRHSLSVGDHAWSWDADLVRGSLWTPAMSLDLIDWHLDRRQWLSVRSVVRVRTAVTALCSAHWVYIHWGRENALALVNCRENWVLTAWLTDADLVAHLQVWLDHLWHLTALDGSFWQAVHIKCCDVTMVFDVRRRHRAGFATVRTHTFAHPIGLNAALDLSFAAASSSTLGHEGPNCDDCNDSYYEWQDDFLAHEGVHKFVFEGRFFLRTGLIDTLHVHLDVWCRMVLRQLLEPLVTRQWSIGCLTAWATILRLHVLQILTHHFLSDLEARRNFNACRQFKVVR